VPARPCACQGWTSEGPEPISSTGGDLPLVAAAHGKAEGDAGPTAASRRVADELLLLLKIYCSRKILDAKFARQHALMAVSGRCRDPIHDQVARRQAAYPTPCRAKRPFVGDRVAGGVDRALVRKHPDQAHAQRRTGRHRRPGPSLRAGPLPPGPGSCAPQPARSTGPSRRNSRNAAKALACITSQRLPETRLQAPPSAGPKRSASKTNGAQQSATLRISRVPDTPV
jgi:hypothetical protein